MPRYMITSRERNMIYHPSSRIIARSLVQHGAFKEKFRERPENWFQWKSGVRAPVYTDCRRLGENPGVRRLIKTALGSALRDRFPDAEVVVGIAEGGLCWSTIAADEASLPHIFVRKNKKNYGIQCWVEYQDTHKDARAVMVDDTTSTGDTALMAADLLKKEAQISAIGVLCIVSHMFPNMRGKLESRGIVPVALVSYADLLNAAVESLPNKFPRLACDELFKFYSNPFITKWNLAALRSVRR